MKCDMLLEPFTCGMHKFRPKLPYLVLCHSSGLLSGMTWEVLSALAEPLLTVTFFSRIFQVLTITDCCLYVFFTELSQKLLGLHHVIW
jgi:hypothetical protein